MLRSVWGKSGMLAAAKRSFPCTEDCNDLSRTKQSVKEVQVPLSVVGDGCLPSALHGVQSRVACSSHCNNTLLLIIFSKMKGFMQDCKQIPIGSS